MVCVARPTLRSLPWRGERARQVRAGPARGRVGPPGPRARVISAVLETVLFFPAGGFVLGQLGLMVEELRALDQAPAALCSGRD
eukprot:4746757-Pyramimonas_sp.AAC.1